MPNDSSNNNEGNNNESNNNVDDSGKDTQEEKEEINKEKLPDENAAPQKENVKEKEIEEKEIEEREKAKEEAENTKEETGNTKEKTEAVEEEKETEMERLYRQHQEHAERKRKEREEEYEKSKREQQEKQERAEKEAQQRQERETKEREEEQKRQEEERRKRERQAKELEEKMMLLQQQVGLTQASDAEFSKHQQRVSEAHKALDAVDPSYVRSSAEFKYFKGSLEEVDELAKNMVMPATSRELRKYARAYKTLAEDADNYLEHKKKDKNPSKLARKRINFVADKKKFAETNRDFWKEQYLDSLKVNALDEDSLTKNAQNVSDFMEDLGEVDPFYMKSSKEFAQVKTCLKDLKKISDKMGKEPSEEDLRKYMLATKRLQKACNNYKEYKGEPNTARGMRRMDFVDDLIEFTETNSADFERLAKEKGYEFDFTEEELQLDYENVNERSKNADISGPEDDEAWAKELWGDDEEYTEKQQNEKQQAEPQQTEYTQEQIDWYKNMWKQESGPAPEEKSNAEIQQNGKGDNDFEEIEGITFEDFWDREYGEMAKLKGIDENSLKQNAQMIKELGDDIDKLDGRIFKAPEDFRKMKRAAGELKTMAEKMADVTQGEPTGEQFDAYMQKGLELVDIANQFIDAENTRKNIEKNDKDTVKRVDCAMKVRECMKLNLQSVGDLQEDMKKEAEAELEAQKQADTKDVQTIAKEKEAADYSRQTDLGSEACKKAYTGNTDVRQMNNPHQYAVATNGVQALGEMYLMASGDYTLEEIVNPDSLRDKKAEAGQEVMKHIKGGSEEDQKWLAATIYQGQKNGMKLMNEYAGQFDLTDSGFLKSEECANMGHMCQTMNESFKAMDQCKEQYVSMAKEMDNKNLNFNAHKQEMKNDIYLVSALTTSAKKMHESVVKSEQSPENNYLKSAVLENAIVAKTTQNLIGEQQKKNPDAPITGLLKDKESVTHAKNVINGVRNDEKVEEFNGKLPQSQEVYDRNLGNIVSGRMFGNVKVNDKDGAVTVSNLPSIEAVKEEQTYAKMSGVKLDRLVQEQNRNTDRLLNSGKIDNPNQIEVMERSKDSRTKLAELGKKEGELTPEEAKLAKNYMKDIVAEKFLTYAVNNNISLNPEAYDYTSGVEKMPAFQKESAYISQGNIKRFLSEDRGTEMIKETIVEQKRMLDEQKAKEAELIEENIAGRDRELESGQKEQELKAPKKKEPLEAPQQAPML